jgi:histone acetyltransferase (RNA polymerase elongator complex component)
MRAESIAREHGKDNITALSRVDVQNYYRKMDYEKEGHYMGKIFHI